MSNENNNGGLYFIVGALLVAVVVLTMLYMNGTPNNDEPNVIERTIERTVETDSDEGSSFSLDINEDGVSASTTNSN